jgi:hypothetical protein
MKKLPVLVFCLGLALLPECANAQNTPTTTPLSGTPSASENELPESGGVGTRWVNPAGWQRYLPETPTGWAALLVGSSWAMSVAWGEISRGAVEFLLGHSAPSGRKRTGADIAPLG